MTQLLLDNEGREAIREGIIHLAKRRLSRRWKRAFVVAFEAWRTSGTFDRSVLIDAMNDAHDDEVRDLYRLLASVGALPVTIGDLEYNVNQDTGSDITGDGSAAAPYATMWFLDYLPQTIRHHVRILIHSDHSEYNINTSRFCIEREGFISFVGVSAPEVLSSGHIVANLMTSYNAVQFTAPVALEEALSGGWWLQEMTAGAFQYWAHPILTNKADIIYYPVGDGTALNPNPGDSMRIMRPALTLSVENMVLSHRASADLQGGAYWASNRVTFCNLRIDVTGGRASAVLFDAPTAFTFCTILSSGNIRWQGRINDYPAYDNALLSVSGCEVKNLSSSNAGMGPGIVTAGLHVTDSFLFLLDGAVFRHGVSNSYMVMFGNSRISGIGIRGELNLVNKNHADDNTGTDQYTASIAYVLSCVPADGGNSINCYNSTTRIRRFRFINRTAEINNAFIQWWGLCHVSLEYCGQDTTFPATFPHVPPDYGIFGGTWGTRLFLGDIMLEWDPTSASYNLDGMSADLRFDDGAIPTTLAFPAAPYTIQYDTGGISRVFRGAI